MVAIANTDDQDASFAKLTVPGGDTEEIAQVLRDPICSRNSWPDIVRQQIIG